MVNSIEFSKRLEKILQHYDISATDFAEKIDFSRSSISHILNGRNKPSLDFVMKVCQKFPEVNLHWLLNGKGKFPAEENQVGNMDGILRSEPPTYYSPNPGSKRIPPKENHVTISTLHSDEIEKIIFFYSDGTFKVFKN